MKKAANTSRLYLYRSTVGYKTVQHLLFCFYVALDIVKNRIFHVFSVEYLTPNRMLTNSIKLYIQRNGYKHIARF